MNRTSLLVICILCATAAFGQSGVGGTVLNSQPAVFDVPSHPQHASQKALAAEQNMLFESGITLGHGERPLWEVVSDGPVMPLGDAARQLKLEHASVKKAVKVWEN